MLNVERQKWNKAKRARKKQKSDLLKTSLDYSENIINGYLNTTQESNDELLNLINKSDENSVVKSFTIQCTWEKLKSSILILDQKIWDPSQSFSGRNITCSIWKQQLENQDCIINTSCKHIYHPQWLIHHCREYLSKWQYPRNCPWRGCKRILGPQEITKHLNEEEYIKFEAFSLQRSGQK